ncbi:hypothetical protein ACM01_36860 [Streptomyces viridochromogenes]|uniref:Secreted protein n=1 Tax=Streptomyces viridochromogenes TaxID=1938 RepID=A0A0J8BTS1_STRVR|nr:hypothetical protein [Streptomyces viridochromogenes]KMS68970.1 hypothetical protein ACM01_36860 [Streptomyces viridochromogenes]KOG16129.1 hypothetical protein ADK36_28135 [Streptomyces viridochromogenes]KOG16364.1 hypothetical protein ADK35_27040 [Streptomyces viridochromogenes]
MRRFQRVAVVAAAVAGLSAFGVGAGTAFAHEGDDFDGQVVSAVATSTANAVATWGAPTDKAHAAPVAAPQAAPAAPEAAPKAAAPEYGYGEYAAPTYAAPTYAGQ